jgi:hypothetical protein
VRKTFRVTQPSGKYMLRVTNHGVTSAVITLNGLVVLDPNDFTPRHGRDRDDFDDDRDKDGRDRRAAQICRISSRARSATSPRNTLYRYFVIHTTWYFKSNTACAPCRYSAIQPPSPEREAESLPPERRWA